MKKIILSFVFIIASFTIINAQSKFMVGLGASGNLFVQSNPTPDFENHNSILPHLHFKYEPLSFGQFSAQVQANFYAKQIGFSNSYVNNQGGKTTFGFIYEHLATDLVVSVAYNHSITETLLFKPRLGYFLSHNHFFNTKSTYSVSGGTDGSTNVVKVDFSETSSYFHSGIMAGFSFERLKNRSISLFADVYITPRNIFSDPLVFEINGFENELQGKYHYLNIGIRYGLDKF